MSFLRGIGRSTGTSTSTVGQIAGYEERRRTVRTVLRGAGSLACRRCDAPVAIGSERLGLADLLTCPYCSHRAPAREFLSLAAPTRPARVVVRAVVP